MKYILSVILFVNGCASVQCNPGFICDADTEDVIEACASDFTIKVNCKF